MQIGAQVFEAPVIGRVQMALEPGDVLARDRVDRSLSLEASLRGALRFNDLTGDDLDLVELYSCFPVMPKLARRARRCSRGSR